MSPNNPYTYPPERGSVFVNTLVSLYLTISSIILKMKTILFFTIFLTALHAETLIDKLKDGNTSKLKESVSHNRKTESEEQRRLRILTERSEPMVDEVSIEVLKIDVDNNSSISVDYAPKLKQGDFIDNKQKATIKFEHKF